MPKKPIWVTGLNDQDVQTVKEIISELRASQFSANDPLIFEYEVITVRATYPTQDVKLVALWVVRESCKRSFKQPRTPKKSLKDMIFTFWY